MIVRKVRVMEFNERVAFVTGAASGIGEGIARDLASHGVLVVVADRDEEKGTEVAGSVPGMKFVKFDLTDMDSVVAATGEVTEKYGPIDILVNCAGGDVVSPFVNTDEKLWYSLIELNFLGV